MIKQKCYFCKHNGRNRFSAFQKSTATAKPRKADILVMKMNKSECRIFDIVCFDLYVDASYQGRGNKYQLWTNLLNEHGIAASISVMCFGSQGIIHKNVKGSLKRIATSGEEAKETTMK